MIEIKKILKSQYTISVSTRIASVFISIIAGALKARILGQYLNGQHAYIYSWSSTLAIVASLGVYQAYPYYRKEKGKEFLREYQNAIQLMTIILCLFSLIAIMIFDNTTVRIIAVSVPLAVLSKDLAYSVLIEKPFYKNISEMLINIVDIFVLIAAYFTHHVSIFTVILLIILKDLIKSLLYYAVTNCRLPRITKDTFAVLSMLILFGLTPMLSSLMSYMNYRVDVFMLKKYVDYDQIGIYSTGSSLAEQLWIIPEAVRDILMVKLVRGKITDEVTKVSRYSFYIVMCCALTMTFFGRFIIKIMYGAAYEGSYSIAVIEIFGVIGMVFTKMISAYNIVYGKQKINLVFLGVGVVINIITNYLVIPQFGINGAAFATLISYSAIGILFLAYFVSTTEATLRDFFLPDMKQFSNKSK